MTAELIIGAALSAAATKGAGHITEEFLKRLLSSEKKKKPVNSAELATIISSYLHKNYDKCLRIKTLLNRDSPVDMLKIYVDVNFQSSSGNIDQFELIETIEQKKCIMILGNGGTGKSIFMKYLWLACYARTELNTPIFIELRDFNNFISENFLSFIQNTIFSDKLQENSEIFDAMMKEGKFTFILDGFDEVVENRKNLLEKQIIDLSENYPKNNYIISSRPLDYIKSWRKFFAYMVKPFTLKDVTLLIEKTDFDKKIKLKFLSKLKDGLFESHKSFLENPLLSTMMLITFNDFAEIPTRMHVFYEQAFSALILRHDASKSAYNRPLFTNLSTDQFKLVFSYFCMLSYKAETNRFSESKFLGFIEKCKEFTGLDFNTNDFKRDVIERVCLIYQDGLEFVYIHRSFQEYFTSVCLLSLEDDFLKKACEIFVTRISDNVFMLMNGINEIRFDAVIADHFLSVFYNKNTLSDFEKFELLLDKEQVPVYHLVRSRKTKYIDIMIQFSHLKRFAFLIHYLKIHRSNNKKSWSTIDSYSFFKTTFEAIPSSMQLVITSNVEKNKAENFGIRYMMHDLIGVWPSKNTTLNHVDDAPAELGLQLDMWFPAQKSYKILHNAAKAAELIANEICKSKREYDRQMKNLFEKD